MKKENLFYVVSVEDTKKYGVIKAIILGRIRFWCDYHKGKKTNFHLNRYWSGHLSHKDLSEQTGIPEKTISRHIKELLDINIIFKGTFNKKGFDRTGWYTLEQPIIKDLPSTQNEEMDIPNLGRPSTQSGGTIPVKHSINLTLNNREDHILDQKKIKDINIIDKEDQYLGPEEKIKKYFPNTYQKIFNQLKYYNFDNALQLTNGGYFDIWNPIFKQYIQQNTNEVMEIPTEYRTAYPALVLDQ